MIVSVSPSVCPWCFLLLNRRTLKQNPHHFTQAGHARARLWLVPPQGPAGMWDDLPSTVQTYFYISVDLLMRINVVDFENNILACHGTCLCIQCGWIKLCQIANLKGRVSCVEARKWYIKLSFAINLDPVDLHLRSFTFIRTQINTDIRKILYSP